MLGKETIESPRVKIYLGISKGKIVKTLKDGSKETYSYIEGFLEDIYQKERTFNGQAARFWYIELRDEEELYSLSIPYSSGVFKSIILALASEPELTRRTPVRIEPYLGDNSFTKVAVFANGVKLDWIEKELPPIEEKVIGSQTFRDDTKRMEFICSLAEAIKKQL